MYRISELEDYLKCTYPSKISSEIQEHRQTNIGMYFHWSNYFQRLHLKLFALNI